MTSREDPGPFPRGAGHGGGEEPAPGPEAGGPDADARELAAWARRTLAVVGLGQIGGSLAAAVRPLVARVLGLDRDPAAVAHARAAGWIDAGASGDWSLLSEADALVVAVPVGDIPAVLAAAAPHLRPGCLVTDTGSVKGPVVEAAARLLPAAHRFAGGHPMAGTERSGPAAADPGLFRGRTWVLTPSPPWGEAAARPWAALLRAAGARILYLDPREHDRHVALSSHLPLLVAVALARAAAAGAGRLPYLPDLVAGGFRDTSRVAAGEPAVGGDILAANWAELQPWLQVFRDELDRLAAAAARADRDELRALLAAARRFRARLMAATPVPGRPPVAGAGDPRAARDRQQPWPAPEAPESPPVPGDPWRADP